MRHIAVLGGALLLILLLGGTTLAVSHSAARDQDRVTVMFAPGTPREVLFLKVAEAEGRIIRDTVLPFAVEVMGDEPGIARRLERAGAMLVVSRLPTHLLGVGGCSFLAPRDYTAGTAKMRAGPL